MKTLAILLFSLFMSKGCQDSTQQEQDLKKTVIEYVANTRGFYQKIKVENKLISITNDRSGNEKARTIILSENDWNELVVLFQKVKLEELSTLKAPTEKRFYDGAAIANLKINYRGKEYQSASFDHGYPPAEIKEIVNKINSFTKQDNEN
ncbi:hypothetical protein [Flavobacterium sp. 7A]|uniref:hypothetical protein n=1 Tax=Flavobacterium sp. 7A TaxID=2940571 RepID=UPI0022266836|nr:hypothetical protein [Flavobacterium sp. 7A]MCW2120485.1 hypothetical protein [Flavobacterium sp. 7A]